MSGLEAYATQGVLYFIDGLSTKEGIIGLNQDDHIELVARGFSDEEVNLTVRSLGRPGGAPSEGQADMWASLLTMRVDGEEKFQIRLSASAVERLKSRGFTDLEPVSLEIEKLSYTVPAQQFEEGALEPALSADLLPFDR